MFKLLNMVTYTKYPDFLIKRHANISDDSYEQFQNVHNFGKIFFFQNSYICSVLALCY